MLDFSQDFFRAEERSGFLVDVTMKTVWAAELEVLCEIAKVCEKYDITWYMVSGSLLGAVRHEGFIPWDDDIDICLFREDYQSLLSVLQDELPEGYVVRSPLLENGYPEYHTFVANSDSISIEPERLKKFHGCPFVVGVDVYPLDEIPKDEDILARTTRAFKLIRRAVQIVKKDRELKELEDIAFELKNDFQVILDDAIFDFEISENERNEMASMLWRIANEIVMKNQGPESSGNVGSFLTYVKRDYTYKKEWFSEVIELPFEGFGVPAPVQYDKVLKADYGDYSEYKMAEASHEYPFYKRQLEDLRKRVKEFEEKRL